MADVGSCPSLRSGKIGRRDAWGSYGQHQTRVPQYGRAQRATRIQSSCVIQNPFVGPTFRTSRCALFGISPNPTNPGLLSPEWILLVNVDQATANLAKRARRVWVGGSPS